MYYIITEEQKERLSSGWKISNGKLKKKFKFKNYKDVLDFVNKVGSIAEKQNHHPDMLVNHNSVEVSLIDHEKGKVSSKCHKLSKAINEI